MEDQFCTSEISKALKELGFNEKCFGYYGNISKALFFLKHGGETTNNTLQDKFHNDENICTAAPLWQQAIDWLYQKHFIYISIEPWKDHAKGTGFDGKLYSYNKLIHRVSTPNPNQSRESVILKAIEILKEK